MDGNPQTGYYTAENGDEIDEKQNYLMLLQEVSVRSGRTLSLRVPIYW